MPVRASQTSILEILLRLEQQGADVMDVHSPATRSFNMSRIRGKDTRPEMTVRRILWARGYRYRLHRKDLPGKPDLVLKRYRATIFVHGCYWHRHGCLATTIPATRRDFWLGKFEGNVARDRRNVEALRESGWRVLVVWECSLRGKDSDLDAVIERTTNFLNSDVSLAEIPMVSEA